MSAEPLGLVIDTNPQGQPRVELQTCSQYRTHHTAVLERHHVVPDSWWVAAGKDPAQSPIADLCPDCHSATHVAIDSLLAKRDVSLLPPRCVRLAWRALELAQYAGLTPAPTL